MLVFYFMKKCIKCGLEKSKDFYYKNKRSKDGLQYSCKRCVIILVEKRRIKLKELKPIKKNITEDPDYKKKYAYNNKETIRQKQKEYYQKNKEILKIKNNLYRIKNKDKVNEKNNLRIRKKLKECDFFKCKTRILNLIRTSIKSSGYSKKSKTYNILGCEYHFFKNYIEAQFKKGMNWNNIHLDHIKPISLAKNEKEIIELNHYTNFQPLFVLDNLKKSNKIIEKQLRLI